MNWEILLGYFTGLRFLTNDLSSSTLLGTTLFIHFLDGIMCRLFAHYNGYPKGLWTFLGFVFGIWAIVALLLHSERQKL